MKTPNHDLHAALAFVIRRINQQADRSATPLDAYETDLLHHLPMTPSGSAHRSWYTPSIPPRDVHFEKLCFLAKEAYSSDIRVRPDSARDWKFVVAALELNQHPMVWLLGWAGVGKRRPRGDRFLLISTAILTIVLGIAGAIALSGATAVHSMEWRRVAFVAAACAYLVACVAMFFAANRFADRQLKRTIENCRTGFVDSTLNP